MKVKLILGQIGMFMYPFILAGAAIGVVGGSIIGVHSILKHVTEKKDDNENSVEIEVKSEENNLELT